MKKLFVLVLIIVAAITGVYAYNSSNIIVSEDSKHAIEYDTKIITIENTSNKKMLVQVEVINDVKTSFGNYQPMSIEYKEVILGPKEKKNMDIIQYHTRKVRYDIVKEVELK